MVATSESAESVWVKRLAHGAGGFCCLLGSGPGQALEAFWRDIFSTTRLGSRVLEIGCGSGDVSVWAAEAGRQLEVIASDIHDRADLVRQHPGIRFLANAKAEALPIPAASIDMVVSNFAFEYTPSPRLAVSELARVLRPRGVAALVVHSDDSAVTASSRRLLDTYKALVASGIPEQIRQAMAFRPDHLSRRKLLKNVLKMRDTFPDQSVGIRAELYFEIAYHLLQGNPKAREKHAELEETVDRLVEMSEAQIEAALDGAALAGLESQFKACGMQVHSSEITGHYDALDVQKFGWLVFLNR